MESQLGLRGLSVKVPIEGLHSGGVPQRLLEDNVVRLLVVAAKSAGASIATTAATTATSVASITAITSSGTEKMEKIN